MFLVGIVPYLTQMAYKGYAVYRSLYLGHTESNAMVISSQV